MDKIQNRLYLLIPVFAFLLSGCKKDSVQPVYKLKLSDIHPNPLIFVDPGCSTPEMSVASSSIYFNKIKFDKVDYIRKANHIFILSNSNKDSLRVGFMNLHKASCAYTLVEYNKWNDNEEQWLNTVTVYGRMNKNVGNKIDVNFKHYGTCGAIYNSASNSVALQICDLEGSYKNPSNVYEQEYFAIQVTIPHFEH